jgi:hypothetical protein
MIIAFFDQLILKGHDQIYNQFARDDRAMINRLETIAKKAIDKGAY